MIDVTGDWRQCYQSEFHGRAADYSKSLYIKMLACYRNSPWMENLEWGQNCCRWLSKTINLFPICRFSFPNNSDDHSFLWMHILNRSRQAPVDLVYFTVLIMEEAALLLATRQPLMCLPSDSLTPFSLFPVRKSTSSRNQIINSLNKNRSVILVSSSVVA